MNLKLKITEPKGSLETKGVVDSITTPSFMDTMMRELVKQVNEKFEVQLKSYLLENLKRIGYTFESDDAFYNFLKSRVTRLDFGSRPNHHEFRLDHSTTDTEHRVGRLIGSYSDELDIEFDDGKVNVTMGRNIHDKW